MLAPVSFPAWRIGMTARAFSPRFPSLACVLRDLFRPKRPRRWAGRRAGAVPLGALSERKIYIAGKSGGWAGYFVVPGTLVWYFLWIYTRWNLTPINLLARHIAVHLMRSAAIRSVNCAGMPTRLTTSSAAPVSDSLRMRQAIVRPLNSMLPVFMKRPLSADLMNRICNEKPGNRPGGSQLLHGDKTRLLDSAAIKLV